MFNNLLKWLQATGQTILTDLGLVATVEVQSAVTSFDNLVRKYTPVAVAPGAGRRIRSRPPDQRREAPAASPPS